MAQPSALRDPWLIAVWPGMGNVALTAGGYLVAKLGAHLADELHAGDIFDLKHVEVKGGLARPGRLPRSMLFEWRDPKGARDMIIFIGEAQPPTGGYAFCHRLLDYAIERGVKRLYTFAAMATQLHPSEEPRVFGVTTEAAALQPLRALGVEILEDGQISGLNGVLLAAGATRGIPGVCLLGEMPFFAVGVSNPKASKVVLDVFTGLAGLELDLAELERQAEAVEEGLLELLEKMKEAARQQSETGEEPFAITDYAPGEEEDEEREGETTEEPEFDYATRRRIEALFEEARQDRSKAFRLKQELDRLGVFRKYEDRFLDLFKRGE